MVIRPQLLASRVAARRTGFTLLEVLIVVAILVVLAGVGGVTYMSYLDKANISAAKLKMKNLITACTAYSYQNNGEFPQSLESLTQPQADGTKPPLEPDALLDPWGKQFQYDPSGANSGGTKPDISTTSPNGTPIRSWEK